jgi:hypothetical protein
MIQFQGDVGRMAIGTLMVKLLEHVGAGLPAPQRAPLVLHPGNLRILQELEIKLYPLHFDAREGYPPLVALCPVDDVPDTAPE